LNDEIKRSKTCTYELIERQRKRKKKRRAGDKEMPESDIEKCVTGMNANEHLNGTHKKRKRNYIKEKEEKQKRKGNKYTGKERKRQR
jgi:hypothetical protein